MYVLSFCHLQINFFMAVVTIMSFITRNLCNIIKQVRRLKICWYYYIEVIISICWSAINLINFSICHLMTWLIFCYFDLLRFTLYRHVKSAFKWTKTSYLIHRTFTICRYWNLWARYQYSANITTTWRSTLSRCRIWLICPYRQNIRIADSISAMMCRCCTDIDMLVKNYQYRAYIQPMKFLLRISYC